MTIGRDGSAEPSPVRHTYDAVAHPVDQHAEACPASAKSRQHSIGTIEKDVHEDENCPVDAHDRPVLGGHSADDTGENAGLVKQLRNEIVLAL